MPVASVQRIPDEVWGQIFERFECTLPTVVWWMAGANLDRSRLLTLKSLCLVSRQFRRCAQPLLYKNLVLEGARPNEDAAFGRTIRELLLNPSLGKNARLFSAHNLLDDPHSQQNKVDQLATAITMMDLPPRFRQFLESSHFEANQINPALLCLLFTPNVKLVDVTVGDAPLLLSWLLSGSLEFEKASFLRQMHKDDKYIWWHVFGDYGTGYEDDKVVSKDYANFGLPQLKEVRLKHGGDEVATPINEIEAAFMHPGVEIMRTVGVDWRVEHLHRRRWPQPTSNVRLLELKECIMDAEGIENVFELCPRLESLSIELGDDRRALGIDDDDLLLQLDSVGRVLRKYGRNLIELDLHTAHFDAMAGSTQGILGSLQGLQKLRHLKVVKRDLVGHTTYCRTDPKVPHLTTVLPHSLETLYLHYDQRYFNSDIDETKRKGTDKEIFQLITCGKFPNLRQIKAERYLIDSMPFKRKIKGWKSEMRAKELWVRPSSEGCMRTIVVVSKIE